MSQDQRVVVVTGASRGAGRGIAVALGRTGATVYVTGRSKVEGDAPLPGTIYRTAAEVTEAGGKGVAAYCDHQDDEQVRALFERIRDEHGRLDILVHSATALHDDLVKPGPFWTKSIGLIDILDVGLRSAYVATHFAAPLLVEAKGLVASVSSPGAHCYMHGPAYGAQKAGLDKMAADMAHDFRPYDVTVVSLWPGPLLTERAEKGYQERPEVYEAMYANAETPQFTGLVIDAISKDPGRMQLSGEAHYTADLGLRYGIRDINGKQPPSFRDMLGAPRKVHPAVIE